MCAADVLGEKFQRFVLVLSAVTWKEHGAEKQILGKRQYREVQDLWKRRLDQLMVYANPLIKVLDLLCTVECFIEEVAE
jgi:hypothetical protein